MPVTHEGSRDATGLRFAVVVSRFNSVVTERLLRGALTALRECGAADTDVEVVYVPGAFELPLLVDSCARRDTFDAVIALGAIVRGETQHHDYLGRAVFDALQHLQLAHHRPVTLGVLTTENMEQALRRAGDDAGNKGAEAALTAVETATLLRRLT
jgi:6,7-dimethyl-8-ribityllumazine synthase